MDNECSLAHTITAEKACDQGHGTLCNTAKNAGDQICRGLGGPSGFCANVQNLAQGYCMIAGESYCDKVEATGASAWEAKVKAKCKSMIKELADKAAIQHN